LDWTLYTKKVEFEIRFMISEGMVRIIEQLERIVR
jgi:hypothetical protein